MKSTAALVGLSTVGAIVTGVLGLGLGAVAFLMGNMAAGGTCLIAAALAFGLVLRAVLAP